MKKPHGFSLEKIRSPFEKNAKWETADLSEFEKEEIHRALAQDFHYLGSGAQCYAFLSSDGAYVLKFFKMKHLIPKKWTKFIPFPGLAQYKFKKIDNRILRQQELFISAKIAFEELKEETGTLYVHLNKTKNLKKKVRLYDGKRHRYLIDLDEYEFILQKKAQLVRERLVGLMEQGKREEALGVIHSLLKQVVHQCKKGYIDRDSGISYNYGFVGDQVIHFDTGRIIKDESAKDPAFYQREVLRVGRKLESWLSREYPVLLPDLEEIINAMIDPSFSQKSALFRE